MLKTITSSIAALLFCVTTTASADILAIKPDAPKSYTVKQGDTLWDISGLYLQQPWLWPQLWKLNPQVENPHLIYPGDVLSLSYDKDGQPVLTVNGSALKVSPSDSAAAPGQGIRKLSPQARKSLKNVKAVTTIPLMMIRPFLTYEQSLSAEQIDSLPYVLGADDHVKNASQGHILYVRGQLQQDAAYGIYRKGKAYVDPQTEEILGYETILVGTARAFRAGGTEVNAPASVAVLDVKQEIRQGDRLLPAADGQSLPAFFMMRKPEQPIAGSIIDTTSDLREFSSWDIVVLNKGQQDGVKAGYMFSISRQSPAVVDSSRGPVYMSDASKYQKIMGGIDGERIDMPKEQIGELMVFKVAERTSFAIVTGTKKPIRVGDSIGDL
ncbi:LysM peptidoglycan-binding domain-containing protein [Rheinheimera texasensis]|uniref:LysM peptidoglycan-binding domain-containing protein n=1 Tax=Rheinheimera texasensis TaxID=306205 RepID=UPI0004E23ED7|nr:LysM domain-containing protein [Rheinheimera texasensis]